MSVQVSYKKQMIFFIILIFITLVIAEGIVRASGVVDMEVKCKFTTHELFKHMSFFEKRSLCDEYTSIDYDYTGVIKIPLPMEGKHVNINTDGFRGKEINFQTKDYKIFFLGGSTAFGMISSNDDFTIPALLEKKFVAEGLNVMVINAGIGNFYSSPERYYFEEYLIQYSPNMIIMYDGWNDMGHTDDNFTYEQFKKQPYYVNQIITDDSDTKTGIIKFFAKIDYKTGIGIAKYLSNLLYTKNIEKFDIFSNERLSKVENSLQNNWSEICKLGNENDIKVVNVLHPILGTGNRTFSESEKFSTEYLDQYLWKFKLNDKKYRPCDEVHDLRNVFDDMSGITIYFDNGHMTDFANQILANRIYEKILPTVLEDVSK